MLPLDLPTSWSGGKKSNKKEPIKIVRCKNLRIKKEKSGHYISILPSFLC